MITLGIETSCDETSVAVLDNKNVIHNTTFSQAEHAMYGGVVPEIASRAHLEKIDRLTENVLSESKLTPSDIDLIAVTDSPGLAGALLVGVSFAMGIHTRYAAPITGINHLEGHICSVLLEHPDLTFPFLALVVSGGHTAIYRVDDFGEYTCMGQTVDDAAGEAFDKVGKLLGFDYPAGRAIEEEAKKAQNCNDISFPVAKFTSGATNFSFSGLKTAVKYYISDKDDHFIKENKPCICKAFQDAVVDAVIRNLQTVSEQTGIKKIAMVGGVACNGALRKGLWDAFGPSNVYFPSPHLCTDNAAMIAYAGYMRMRHEKILRFPKMDPTRGI